jgi:hypothetical protein
MEVDPFPGTLLWRRWSKPPKRKRPRGNIMAQPLNLLARDPFKTGDHGYVIRGSVRKLTGSEIPREVIVVTALEDIEAWTNGQFQLATPAQGSTKG